MSGPLAGQPLDFPQDPPGPGQDTSLIEVSDVAPVDRDLDKAEGEVQGRSPVRELGHPLDTRADPVSTNEQKKPPLFEALGQPVEEHGLVRLGCRFPDDGEQVAAGPLPNALLERGDRFTYRSASAMLRTEGV